jgi:murein DD-endopeptidase MepM/ murein hydrolase activator NlpD
VSNVVKFEHLPHDICRVTSAFGYRTNPITGTKKTFHQGIDIGAKVAGVIGDKLRAVADGTVVHADYMPSKVYGYGYYVIIEHDGFCTLYAHMKSLSLHVGTKIKAGNVVGYMGTSGASTAAHLHFEVEPIQWQGYMHYITKNEQGVRKYAVDPYQFIKEYRERLKEDEDVANEVIRYKNISEMPVHYQAIVKELVDKKIIQGNTSGDLNMTEDMVRTLIMAGRMDKLK